MEAFRNALAKLFGSYHGVTPIIAAFVVAYTLTGMAWPKLEHGQIYPEILMSGVSMGDFDKDRDFRVFHLFLTTFAGLSLAISASFRRLSPEGHTGGVGRAINTLLAFTLIPACWRLGDALMRTNGHLLPKEALLLVLATWALAGGLLRYRRELTGPLVLQAGGAALLALVLAYFGGLGVATALGRLVPATCLPLGGEVMAFIEVPLLLTALAVALLFGVTGQIEVLRRRLERLVFLLQIPSLLLFCILIPPPLLDVGRATADGDSPALLLLIGALGLAGLVQLRRRYRAWEAEGTGTDPRFERILSPLALSAIALFLLVPILPYPEGSVGDLFHFAEESPLAWQQWHQFGKRPYADLIPIHGLMPLSRALLNQVFFDGTAAHIQAAELLLLAASVIATFLAMSALESPLLALFVSVSCPVGSRFYFFAPALLVLVNPRLRARPCLWLMAWMVIAPLMVFYNGAIGPAYVLGTAPAASWMLYRLAREDRRALGKFSLAVGLAALLAAPVRDIAVGLVEFVWENQGPHRIGNGCAWEESFKVPLLTRGFSGNLFLWEVLRFSWLLVLVVAVLKMWQELGRPRAERDQRTVWLGVLFVPTLLLCSKWAVGTIDAGAASRIGMMSHVSVVYFLPLLLLARVDAATTTRTVAFLATLITAFNALTLDDNPFRSPGQGAVGCTEYHALRQKPFAVRSHLAGHVVVDGPAIGLPNLGKCAVPADFLPELIEFRDAINSLLGPDETFLDLGNRTGYYFYLGRPVPTLYAGDFGVICRAQQRRILSRLDRDPPPIASVTPSTMYPSNITSVRSYHLYRDALLRYGGVVRRGRFTFLVDPARVPDADSTRSDASLTLLDSLFQWRLLIKSAAAWGASWPSLAREFTRIGVLGNECLVGSSSVEALPNFWFKPNGPGPRVSYRLGDAPVDGAEVDFVKLEIDVRRVPGGADPYLLIGWESQDKKPCSPLPVAVSGRVLLVPLGGTPSWLLNDRLQTLHVTLANPETCKRFRIKSIELLHLHPLRTPSPARLAAPPARLAQPVAASRDGLSARPKLLK